MLRGWLEIGQPYDLFWCLTVSEVHLILHSALRRIEREAKGRRSDIYALACLIGIQQRNPKKMPDRKRFVEGAPPKGRRGSSEAKITAYFLGIAEQQKAGKVKHVA